MVVILDFLPQELHRESQNTFQSTGQTKKPNIRHQDHQNRAMFAILAEMLYFKMADGGHIGFFQI